MIARRTINTATWTRWRPVEVTGTFSGALKYGHRLRPNAAASSVSLTRGNGYLRLQKVAIYKHILSFRHLSMNEMADVACSVVRIRQAIRILS